LMVKANGWYGVGPPTAYLFQIIEEPDITLTASAKKARQCWRAQ
jgi:hypothetical protein